MGWKKLTILIVKIILAGVFIFYFLLIEDYTTIEFSAAILVYATVATGLYFQYKDDDRVD